MEDICLALSLSPSSGEYARVKIERKSTQYFSLPFTSSSLSLLCVNMVLHRCHDISAMLTVRQYQFLLCLAMCES